MKSNQFVKLNLRGMDLLVELASEKKAAAVAVFTLIFKHMDAKTGVLHVSKNFLAEEAGFSCKWVGSALNELVSRKVLREVDKDLYCINPAFVWASSSDKTAGYYGAANHGKKIKIVSGGGFGGWGGEYAEH